MLAARAINGRRCVRTMARLICNICYMGIYAICVADIFVKFRLNIYLYTKFNG